MPVVDLLYMCMCVHTFNMKYFQEVEDCLNGVVTDRLDILLSVTSSHYPSFIVTAGCHMQYLCMVLLLYKHIYFSCGFLTLNHSYTLFICQYFLGMQTTLCILFIIHDSIQKYFEKKNRVFVVIKYFRKAMEAVEELLLNRNFFLAKVFIFLW